MCVSVSFVCVCKVCEATQKSRSCARLCFCEGVRAHLTACPCLRGLLSCICNMNVGKCPVGSPVRCEDIPTLEIKIPTDYTKIINPRGKRSSLVNTL